MRTYRFGMGTVVLSRLHGNFGPNRVERAIARQKKKELNEAKNKVRYKINLDKRFTLFQISRLKLEQFARGDESICIRNIGLGWNRITEEEIELVYSHPNWIEFAENVFDKALYESYLQDTPYAEYYNFHPESWNSLTRERNLLVKRILIEFETQTAKWNEWI